MQSHSTKPLGYYQSDQRDSDIVNAIALEIGDRFECLTSLQRNEALLLVSLTLFTGSIDLALNHFNLSVASTSLPRKFCLLVGQLTRDGWLSLSIALAQSLREHP